MPPAPRAKSIATVRKRYDEAYFSAYGVRGSPTVKIGRTEVQAPSYEVLRTQPS